MTDHDPLDRDELVAAYLDGEVTPAERAMVEADRDLVERATILRQVADMVAEPVLVPPPEVKRAHIAAALAVSATAPNVRSLATKRRRMDMTKVASIAAAVIAVLAVPIILLNNAGDNNDDSATAVSDVSATSADGAEAAAPEPASEPEVASEALDLDDSAAGGDAASEESAASENPAAALEANEPEAEPAPEPPATAQAGTGGGELFTQAARRDLGQLASQDELMSRLLEELDANDDAAPDPDDLPDLQFECIVDWLGDHSTDVASTIAIGTAILDGNNVTYVALNAVADIDQQRVVVFADTCETIADIIAN